MTGVRKNILFSCYISILLISLTTTSGYILASFSASADDSVVDDIVITVPTACTLTGTGMNSHTTSIMPGNIARDIGSTTMKAYCNDSDGFAIYAIGYTDDTDGKTVLTSSALGSTYDIVTGTGTSGNSQWAMRLTTPTTPTPTYPLTIQNNYDSSSYHVVPNDYELVAKRLSATDIGNNAEGSTMNSTYQAYISLTQLAGTYIGKVKYVLVHPHDADAPLSPINCSTGNVICYASNGSGIEGTMGEQTANANALVTLLASNFSRTGYGFAGWNTAYDYSGTFYGPNETITTPADMSAGMPLYAVWVKSEGSIQDTNKVSSVCNRLIAAPTDGTANLSSVSALTDQRDNQTYAIAKLADDKCWMIENLRLDSAYTTSSNANLAQGYNSSFVGLSSSEEFARFANVTTANDLYSIDGSTTKTISGSDQGYRFPRYNNVNTSTRTDSPTANNNNNAFYSYGNYYTWHAVIADTTAYTSNNTSATNTSICPTGWHLPTGGMAYASGNTSGVNVTGDASTFREFYNLGYKIMNKVKTAYEDKPNSGQSYYSSDTTNTAGDTATKAFRKYPNNFVYSGDVSSGSVRVRGAGGYYWSSTAYASISAYRLHLNSSNVEPGTYGSLKYYGSTVRCVAGV